MYAALGWQAGPVLLKLRAGDGRAGGDSAAAEFVEGQPRLRTRPLNPNKQGITQKT